MDNKEISQLIKFIKERYPDYYRLNESTEINNIHLNKLLDAIKILMNS